MKHLLLKNKINNPIGKSIASYDIIVVFKHLTPKNIISNNPAIKLIINSYIAKIKTENKRIKLISD